MKAKQGLYNQSTEFDSCGVGFICHLKGQASHEIIKSGLQMLENMNHRGASGSDEHSGDGAGIMIHTPDRFLRKVTRSLGVNLPPQGQYAVAQVFLPKNKKSCRICMDAFERVLTNYDMEVLGWRDVPVNSSVVGAAPREVEPLIKQLFIAPGHTFFNRYDFDRRLYLVRQQTENFIEFGDFPPDAREEFYICILSANRLVYKGMLTALQLREYYVDLQDPEMESALALVHSRFSTNTNPSWRLAHPFRYLAHNGEINTLRGNRNWMRSRYANLHSEVFGAELSSMFPILTESGSDSATLDNAFQFLAVNGRSVAHSIMMLIPEAWQNNLLMDPELRAFYEYHACLMEPWDGPASIAFTNGYLVGAVLDRNGLRPSRYCVTNDDLVIMASEVGVLPIPEERIKKKWRLEPGRIFLVDMKQGRIIHDDEIKNELIDKRPWKRWIDSHLVKLEDLPPASYSDVPKVDNLIETQIAFGYSKEDLSLILGPMASNAEESVGSMGNDTPLACLSDKPQLIYNYFKQLFAQVTNPPLDAIREELVTSLYTYLGRQGNLLDEKREFCDMLRIRQPIITNTELAQIRAVSDSKFKHITLPILFRKSHSLEGALDNLGHNSIKAVQDGASILILSDRGVDRQNIPIPSLLALAAVNNALINDGIRARCSIILESGEARETHHFSLLIGYGASAVNPYLAIHSLELMVKDQLFPPDLTPDKAIGNYIKACNKALLKVASKMGISTIQSYRGAQIFEALGVHSEVINKYFPNTPSRLGGVTLDFLGSEAISFHDEAFNNQQSTNFISTNHGRYQWRRDGEHHMWNPDTIAKLQHAVRTNDYDLFKQYSSFANEYSNRPCTIRGLLQIKPVGPAISLNDVESAESIAKRFVTGAMSFGSISRIAHETLAIAMNTLGGKSNSGEGGEDPDRYVIGLDGLNRRSAIKQVASGRFGVTAQYLINADEIQIKMAQGAKPGEGGQLPGYKIDAYVGKIRHSTPGVQLISPPPHHDIYSIEDLSQLIHDLKSVNPNARISVKLVSEVGVGTIAAGVAKCKADHILISGDSGGTGAAPLTSIKHTGLPWELGLAETQQALLFHGLRGRVTLQTDGQIKTGQDIIIAALLGAEEIGFATSALVSLGCVMMRVCHLNTCPVGIATQNGELHKRFKGKPEHVVNFMLFLAREVREYLAKLGYSTYAQAVGQVENLSIKEFSKHEKYEHLDLSPILFRPHVSRDTMLYCHERQDHGLDKSLDCQLINQIELKNIAEIAANPAIIIKNTDRSVGAMLSGYLLKSRVSHPQKELNFTFSFKGHAGQSFGAFLIDGVSLVLEGDANDYLGKGLSGGEIVLYPSQIENYKAEDNIIAGNVIAYGATGGEIYIRGQVGERFCVRNSGATVVVEGIGDHGCEYMTGGYAIILGRTGRNFAAGMSGGLAYVFNQNGKFGNNCNLDMVTMEDLNNEDWTFLEGILIKHWEKTKSSIAHSILNNPSYKSLFVKVFPNDYKKALEEKTGVN
ncbi:MAG: glutamate synthase large subunit [Deltaproteobacteria bacterium]|nr:glutamate synthase large subunit [Deltaproteobacteria bacterium]